MKYDSKFLAVYLDQKDWINLARAQHDHSQGRQYKEVLKTVTGAVENKKAIFPLSFYHFVETQKISNKTRQKKLAKTMSKLSQGWGIGVIDTILPIEIEIAGANLFGTTSTASLRVFQKSMSFALGIDLIKLLGTIDDPLAKSESFINIFDQAMSTPEIVELVLTGEVISEADFSKAISGYKKGLAKFAELSRFFRSKNKSIIKPQISHKQAYINQLMKDMEETINSAFKTYNKTVADITNGGDDQVSRFIESIPTLNVEVELISRRNVNWSRDIDENDWADIRFLMAAIPYCDIIVTENFWKDLIEKSGLDKKYKTAILSDINNLKEYL